MDLVISIALKEILKALFAQGLINIFAISVLHLKFLFLSTQTQTRRRTINGWFSHVEISWTMIFCTCPIWWAKIRQERKKTRHSWVCEKIKGDCIRWQMAKPWCMFETNLASAMTLTIWRMWRSLISLHCNLCVSLIPTSIACVS